MTAARIASAIERIHHAAWRVSVAAQASPGSENEAELARRHERLRSETKLALADLDRLIGSLDQ